MGLVDTRNGEQNWPKYALLTHAIELALKAFAFQAARNGPIPNEPKQHDLVGWYKIAIGYGLSDERGIAENLGFLNELHKTHFMRYPAPPSRPVPNPEAIADQTVDHLIFAITQVVNPR
jgi:hypothetical protein